MEQSIERTEPRIRPALLALVLGALVFAALAFLSLIFAREAGRVASIWPANGALLALVLLRPRSERGWLIGGAFLGDLVVNLTMGDTVPIAAGLALANAVEIAVAAILLCWGGRVVDLGRIRTLFRFGLIAGTVAPLTSSVIAAATLAIWHHEPMLANAGRWFVGDALGLLMITPPLLMAASRQTWSEVRAPLRRRLMLAVVLLATLAGVFLQSQFPLLFVVPPVLILIAFRCGAGSASVALLIAAVASLAAVVAGTGPLALVDGGLDQRAMIQQLFLAVLVFTTLPVASVLTDAARSRREAEARMAVLNLTESVAGVGSWRLDLEGGPRVSWSPQVYRIHGVDPTTFDPGFDDAIDFYHPDDRPLIRDWVARAIETGDVEPVTLRLIRSDGEERRVRTQGRVQRGAQNQVTTLFGVFQDVTDAEQAHVETAASERRFRALAEHTSDIIAIFDLDGTFRYLSPAITRVLGWTPQDLVGGQTWSIIHPDDHEPLRLAYRAHLAAGPGKPSPQIRYRGRTKAGGWVWLEAHPTVAWNAAGEPVEIQDTVRDVTAAKALEDALTQAKEAAEAAAEAKSEFLSNMSHELRTPLTSVIGFAGLLKAREGLGETERRFADRIATSSQALLSVINDILDYSKLEAGAVDLDPQPFDPRQMAQGVVGIVEAQAAAKGLDLAIEVEASVPAMLMGDEGRLRQVALNFLSNAVKFTGTGRVTLGLSERDGRLRLAVSDTGIGIAPDKIARLFERFTQADASTTRTYGGTGLGLAISQRLVAMMGGEIGADSRSGEGSTFWLEVPLPVAEGEGEVVSDGTGIALPGGLRVLIADDAAANRELVRAMLSAWDMDLVTVEDGARAVEAVQTGHYDLVLMDVHMPVMDGLEATRAIRSLAGEAGMVPIIALTANVQPEQVEACRAAGMDGHVSKPIVLMDMIAELGRVLQVAEDQPKRGEALARSRVRA